YQSLLSFAHCFRIKRKLMNQHQILLNGISQEDFFNSVREIVRAEIESTQPAPTNHKLFLTLPEAADFLSLSKSTLYRMTSQKEIPHLKRGGKILFNQSDLIAWLKQAQVA